VKKHRINVVFVGKSLQLMWQQLANVAEDYRADSQHQMVTGRLLIQSGKRIIFKTTKNLQYNKSSLCQQVTFVAFDKNAP